MLIEGIEYNDVKTNKTSTLNRYLATKRQDGYFVTDIKSDDYALLSEYEYHELCSYIKVEAITEDSNINISSNNMVCYNADSIKIDVKNYKGLNDVYLDSSKNIDIFNFHSAEGLITLTDTSNVNLFVRCCPIYIGLDLAKDTNIIGLEGKLEHLDITVMLYERGNGVNNHKQYMPMLKGIDFIPCINITIEDTADYANWYKHMENFCFFQTERKLKVNTIYLDIMSNCIYENLVNNIESGLNIVLPKRRLDFFLYDYDTVFDLTVFNLVTDKAFIPIDLWFHNSCVTVEDGDLMYVTIIVEDLYKNGVSLDNYRIQGTNLFKLKVTLKDTKGNSIGMTF